MMARTGVLIMNTGTPDAPTPEAIRPYLKEFLSDRYVVDRPRWFWLPLLNLVILPTRPRKTVPRYQSIWTPEGSPFMVTSFSQRDRLVEELERRGHRVTVELAMRYGNPSLASALERLRADGVERLVVLPLFPQHARVTTETCVVRVFELLDGMGWQPEVRAVLSYHDDPAYLDALTDDVRDHWDRRAGGKLLFSYHSTLLADIEDGDTYADEALATSKAVAERLGIPPEDWAISWQCRFDSRRWLQPTPESVLERWAEEDVTDVAVVCPVFSTDCLETLVDCAVEQKELFERSSASVDACYTYIPALNDSSDYMRALADVVERRL